MYIPIETDARRETFFVVDVSIDWTSDRNWYINLLGTWKVTPLNLLRQESVNAIYVCKVIIRIIIIIIMMTIVIIMIMMIIIAFPDAIRDFFFFFFFIQTPHCAVNRLQYVRSSGLGAFVRKSRATHRALITCNMCNVPRGTKGQLSYYV